MKGIKVKEGGGGAGKILSGFYYQKILIYDFEWQTKVILKFNMLYITDNFRLGRNGKRDWSGIDDEKGGDDIVYPSNML